MCLSYEREKHENKKQGSTDTEVQYDIMPMIKMSKLMYQEMLDKNIAPELARMILPQCMMTEDTVRNIICIC